MDAFQQDLALKMTGKIFYEDYYNLERNSLKLLSSELTFDTNSIINECIAPASTLYEQVDMVVGLGSAFSPVNIPNPESKW